MTEYLILTKDGIDRIYPKIHMDVFGKEPRKIPEYVVVVGSEDDPKGFISGEWTFKDKFYIQDAGIIPKYRKSGWLRHFNVLLQAFDGQKVYTMTENRNIAAMKTLLSAGFIPVGSKMGDKNVLYIEWVKEA